MKHMPFVGWHGGTERVGPCIACFLESNQALAHRGIAQAAIKKRVTCTAISDGGEGLKQSVWGPRAWGVKIPIYFEKVESSGRRLAYLPRGVAAVSQYSGFPAQFLPMDIFV